MNEYGVLTEPGTVRIQRMLPGPIERVWAYLTNSRSAAPGWPRARWTRWWAGRFTWSSTIRS